jgi:hypothetical protein
VSSSYGFEVVTSDGRSFSVHYRDKRAEAEEVASQIGGRVREYTPGYALPGATSRKQFA